MKRKILIFLALLLLVILSFLYYSNKKTEGLWVLHYALDVNDADFKWHHASPLLNIENNKLNTYSYGRDGVPYTVSFFSFGNRMAIFHDDYLEVSHIVSFSKDSMILDEQHDNYRQVYKKFPDSLKNNSDWHKILNNKAFQIRFPNAIDTIYFDDHYLMAKARSKSRPYTWSSQGWELVKVRDFDIMQAGLWNTLILQEKDGKLTFNSFDNQNNLSSFELTEINIDLTEVKKEIEKIKKESEIINNKYQKEKVIGKLKIDSIGQLHWQGKRLKLKKLSNVIEKFLLKDKETFKVITIEVNPKVTNKQHMTVRVQLDEAKKRFQNTKSQEVFKKKYLDLSVLEKKEIDAYYSFRRAE